MFETQTATEMWDAIEQDETGTLDVTPFVYRWRWPDVGAPSCPYCSTTEPYIYECRRIMKCRNCKRQFSVTSMTPLHHMKLSIDTAMLLCAMMVRGERPRDIADTFYINENSVRLLASRLKMCSDLCWPRTRA